MFTPNPNQGFNPEIGGGMPSFSEMEASFSASLPQDASWENRMFLEDRMDELVKSKQLSKASADWLIADALGDPTRTQQLIHRFNRPEGFNGSKF